MRRLLLHRHLAALLCAAALLLKLIVPTGYMVTSQHGLPAIVICPGVAPAPAAMAMPGMQGVTADHGAAMGHGSKEHGRTDPVETPCAFAGLSAAALGTIDVVLLAALIAFVMALRSGHVRPPAPFAFSHLRPPLRGPPGRY